MNNHTSITIAICTYNRADYLKDTLQDLSVQTADRNRYEILVINNNCTDHTQEVCTDFKKEHSELNFRVVAEKEQGLSYARNRALKEADYDAILYIDDDVYLPDDFVETALTKLKRYPSVKCAGGRILVSFDEESPDWIPKELMPMFGLHDLGEGDRRYPSSNFPRGGNMLIHRELFNKYGGFSTNLGRVGKKLLGSEEKAFFEKVRKGGEEIYYWGELKLHHRIGPDRLKQDYLKKQSIGIGMSERYRLPGSAERIGKLMSELLKFGASIILSILYLIRGKVKASRFILQFRVWVLRGFLKGDI